MKKVNTEANLPIKMWLEDLEEGALDQAKNLANLPFAFKHIPIMPDSHTGYGMPIGSILATKGAVVPNAVGVDIGCGMCATKTHLTDITKDQLKEVMGIARTKIPLGMTWHEEDQDESLMPKGWEDLEIVSQQYHKALKQVGTLGGGNHFIEIQKGDDGFIWIMIHSGSRNIGYSVAKHYNKLAKELNEKWCSKVEKEQELAFFPINTNEARNYIKEMNYCIEFAKTNRFVMMDRMLDSLEDVMGEFNTDEVINESHNLATYENHFGHNVLVHRKGATQAFEGQLGMIPGSMGTSSYIVRGLGNPDSFKSCSHGAGRKMGRKKAIQELDLESEIRRLNEVGVVHGVRNQKDLDEAPSAYKDINEVISNQTDLCEVVVELTPIAVIKG